jgi:hypothetical protein
MDRSQWTGRSSRLVSHIMTMQLLYSNKRGRQNNPIQEIWKKNIHLQRKSYALYCDPIPITLCDWVQCQGKAEQLDHYKCDGVLAEDVPTRNGAGYVTN